MAISTSFSNDSGYLGKPPEKPTYDVMVIDNVAHKIHSLVVHTFSLGDVEDPELYAAQPIWEWQQTDNGKWVMEHAVEVPVFHKHVDYVTYGYRYAITAKLKEQDAIIWALKK